MKVQGSDAIARLQQTLQRAESKERTRPVGQGQADDIQVSSRALELQLLKGATEVAPPIREDLVAELSREIASGQYRIDGTRVADALIEEDPSIFYGPGRDDVGN